MKKRMKQALAIGLMVMGVGWLAGRAQAASTDTMTVSVTPNAQYGVSISSPYAGGFNFGTVSLNSTTQSTSAIVVTNNGTIYEYFGISISNTSGSWNAVTVTPSTDTFRMSALLNTGGIPPLGSGSFTALSNTPPALAAAAYGQSSTKTSPTSGNNTKDLWLQLEMPFTLNLGGAGQQTMTLSVTGQGT
jgi:hypothetical protein